jgi:hypothetical protein
MRQNQPVKIKEAFLDLQPDGDKNYYREENQQPVE